MFVILLESLATLSNKYSVQSKENNKKSSANILPFDDKNHSTIGKAEGF